MISVLFATNNTEKLHVAKKICDQNNIIIKRESLSITEIQAHNSEDVAIDKAKRAYSLIGKPLIISDDSWSFPGLRGFPGAYMHDMNSWLTPQDFLRLTAPLNDRRVILTQYLVFIDRTGHTVFAQQVNGKLLRSIQGVSRHSSQTIIAIPDNQNLSIAQLVKISQIC